MSPQYEAGIVRMPINESNCSAYNRAIIDLLPGAFCILNLDKTIRFVNERAVEFLGFTSPFECIGRNLLDYIAPENRMEVEEGLKRTLLKRVGSFSKYIIQRPDGTRTQILAASSLAVDKFGAPIGFVCVAHDQEIHNVSATASQQLVSNRAFFYLDIMSHDISNQLQVALSATELLHYHLKDTEHENLLNDVLNAIEKCDRIIETSEIMEKIVSSETKIRSLREAIDIAMMQVVNDHDVDIIANLEIGDSNIIADEFLEQLLFAILDNACIHNNRDEKMIWIQAMETNSGYLIVIGDNGPGIPDQMKPTLLETRKRKGGLGLHLCRLISDKYGGNIIISDRVKQSPELGTQVEVWFPKIATKSVL